MSDPFEEVRKEGQHEGAVEIACLMLADDVPYETVAKYTKLSLEEIKALDAKKSA